MSRRRRHSSSSSHAETEVWPAYVDVLAAAFVFVLLAFAALLTRDVADEDERNRAHKEEVEEAAQFESDYKRWLEAGTDAVKEAAREMAADLTPVGLAGDCTLPDAAQLSLNPLLVASFSEKQLQLDPQHRHPVTLVCSFPETALRFPNAKAEPEADSKREFVPKLQGLAERAAKRQCDSTTAGSSWCCAGLEVVGHTDCRPLSEENRTNWELSTDRASWVLRQMVSGITIGDLRQQEFRLGANGRADREPRVDTAAICADQAGLQRMLANHSTAVAQATENSLGRNRRVEVLIFLRTKPLPARPVPPVGVTQ